MASLGEYRPVPDPRTVAPARLRAQGFVYVSNVFGFGDSLAWTKVDEVTDSKVDFDQLAHLGSEVRRAQSSLDAGVQGFSGAPSAGSPLLPGGAGAFGNTGAGATCTNAQRQAQSAMGAVLQGMAKTIDADAERLEMALALYRKTEADAADEMLKKHNQLDVFSAQLSNAGPHAAEQTAEIDRLRGLAGDQTAGNTVVAGDFNSVSSGTSSSAQAIREFGDQGFDVNAGDIHDGKGGTSYSHHPIDFVMPRGVGASSAQRWDRDPSDHDGQVVDVTLSDW
ncbi:endonuclease/exonuclease/phosphatase family protein [Asanoa sp. NPDC049573]|uniref:endonuclease/exonuclease/phosphatase family protein n=1 Tax=Asanoa sp. NPDC049573 TaxID=3155396 RepID=UPI00343348CF